VVKVCAVNTKNECGKGNSDSEAEIARGNESEHQLMNQIKIKSQSQLKIKRQIESQIKSQIESQLKSQSNESNSWCLRAKINIKKAMQPRTKWLPSTRRSAL